MVRVVAVIAVVTKDKVAALWNFPLGHGIFRRTRNVELIQLCAINKYDSTFYFDSVTG